jgi:hypothetical protein
MGSIQMGELGIVSVPKKYRPKIGFFRDHFCARALDRRAFA